MNEKVTRREFLKIASKYSLLGAVLLLGSNFLTACSHYNIKNEPINSPKGKIFFLAKSLGYSFFVVQHEAVQRAVKERGYELVLEVANMNETKQIEQLSSIKEKPTAIICDPVSSNLNISRILTSQWNEEIPIAIIDTPLNKSVSISVMFDNYLAGELAAKKIIKLLIEKYGEPRGIILNCYGDLNSEAWSLRKRGFEDHIKLFENIELVSKGTNGDITKMFEVTNEVMKKYPRLDAIHAPSETPAHGVYEALIANRKLVPVGDPNHIIFVTIDGEPIAHKWIKEGILDASISQDPIAYGEISVEILIDYLLNNKSVPTGNFSNRRYYWNKAQYKMTENGANIIIPPFIIDKSNVDDDRHWANIAIKKWGLSHL